MSGVFVYNDKPIGAKISTGSTLIERPESLKDIILLRTNNMAKPTKEELTYCLNLAKDKHCIVRLEVKHKMLTSGEKIETIDIDETFDVDRWFRSNRYNI